MFFENLTQIPEIAAKTDCAIFILPDSMSDEAIKAIEKYQQKNKIISFSLEPEKDKKDIAIEQVRELISGISTKEQKDRFIVIRPADRLNESSGNALLKNLEEPHAHYHYILITANASDVLPTILSRSAIYIYKVENQIDQKPAADAKTIEMAKKLITATPKSLIECAETINKKKDNARLYALEVLSTAIEILYKSYYKTNNQMFLKKLPKFVDAYTNINNNGHIKIHIIADLM